ncbi:CaiB/BaiF CoA transferase family protein [Cupriavidus plantarum]|uniref:CaiB/BaiF CoA transferase family protein n=1 Tax=Cupriavidus plantarum TaxID=942865 RepID=UPI000EB43BDF|nr:CaiB/BaiF CoA-transferase family protein [Cupriavidus plantarum]RLK35640.1 alpha-methylacyl-CoA racemase [Cupriavidus plantarum]
MRRQGLLPLQGVRVVEFEGIGPGPLCGAMLAGLGATVTLVARPVAPDARRLLLDGDMPPEVALDHDKNVMPLDLKSGAGRAAALDLVADADALIEGLRPGVMERLGLGPADCHARNARLVYGRMTGWGQMGPLAQQAGHDINYLALSGLLHAAARDGALPKTPPTVMGDATGALGLAFGITSAILHARATGQGCVVDAAITDIAAMLGALLNVTRAAGTVDGPHPSPFHDSPFYDVYRCADGRALTFGALEPPFYRQLLARLGFDDVDPDAQYDRALWPALKARLTAAIAGQPLAYWRARFEGTDACFAPVLTIDEAARHPHNVARDVYRVYAHAGREVVQAMPAPRFTPAHASPADGTHS